MKVTLESTEKVVTLVIDGAEIRARIWQGYTEHGVPMHAFIPRVGVETDQDQTEFQAALKEHVAPRTDIVAIPYRMVI